MTGTLPTARRDSPLSEIEARRLTNQINGALTVAWDLVITAYERGVWEPLGYASWDSYCRAEFGTARLRLPAEERAETVHSLREAGLSTRAIAAATGLGHGTVGRETAGVPDGTPARVTGTDGKTYSGSPKSTQAEQLERDAGSDRSEPEDQGPPPAAAPRRRSLTDQAQDAGHELRKAVDRAARLVDDDRFPQNREQVTRALRGHLLHALTEGQRALDRMSDSANT